jgi:hypothetical protein
MEFAVDHVFEFPFENQFQFDKEFNSLKYEEIEKKF